jgi:prolyl oligopeptidase
MKLSLKFLWAVPACVAGLLVPSSLSASIEYPTTPQREEIHTYGTVRLSDPFAWLEEHTAPEAEAWFRAQDALTRSSIAAMPDRPALFERIKQIDEAKTVEIYSFNRRGERYFYLRREVGEEVGRLFVQEGLEGEGRLLVDPNAHATSDMIHAIEWYSPSPDGSLVAVGIAPGGSEIPVLYLINTTSGEVSPTTIDRVQWGISWLEDGSGFTYTQLRPQDPSEERVEWYKRKPSKFHRLGTSPENDPVLVSYDENRLPGQSAVDTPVVFAIPESRWSVAMLSHGVDRSRTVFVAEGADFSNPASIEWRPLIRRSDKVESFNVHGDRIFMLSALDAPRFRILEADIPTFAQSSPRVLVPEGAAVLTGLTILGERLYVTSMEGGVDAIAVMDLEDSGGSLEPIELPLIGRVTLLSNDYRMEDVYIGLTSWAQAPAYYRYDPATGAVEMSGIRPLGPYDAPEGIVVERLLVPSHDGVEVPLTIMHHESVALDGSNPTILYGYGAYGNSMRPAFGPTRLAWLERGGVYAVAHVRGGGEFGKEWHAGGHKSTKRNSWLDFHACAEYLIERGYASAGTIGAMGGSMGGVLVGRAVTSRPELYGAVVSNVGNHNPVRNHRRANGPANYPEYGNPLDPEEFPYVLAMDSYFAVRPGVTYPPALITSGFNDARVDPWMPGKFAARLQTTDPVGGPFFLRVEFSAGHGGVARSDVWEEIADTYAFLFWSLEPRADGGHSPLSRL